MGRSAGCERSADERKEKRPPEGGRYKTKRALLTACCAERCSRRRLVLSRRNSGCEGDDESAELNAHAGGTAKQSFASHGWDTRKIENKIPTLESRGWGTRKIKGKGWAARRIEIRRPTSRR
jgi:hypothetical protein